MKRQFSVSGIRRDPHPDVQVGFKSGPELHTYEVFLEGVHPHQNDSMSLIIGEHDIDLFPIDGAVAVTVEPKLAGKPTHGETQP